MEYKILMRDRQLAKLRETYLSRPSTPIKHLKIERYMSTVWDFQKFLAQLRANKYEHLELYHITMSDENVAQFAECIRSCPTLTELTLTRCKCRANHIQEISCAVSDQGAILNVNLNNTRLNDQCCDALRVLFESCPRLKEVKLVDTAIADAGLNRISQGLAICTGLKLLDLSYNSFSSESLGNLVSAFEQTMTTESLKFQGFQMFLPQAEAIAAWLSRSDCKIRDLILHECETDDSSIKTLVDSLQLRPYLRRLSLAHNPLSSALMDTVNQMLTKQIEFKGLVSLCLANVGLSTESFAALTVVLKNFDTLRYLNLAWNRLASTKCGQILADLLKSNHSLEKVLFHHNVLGAEGAQAVGTSLQHQGHSGLRYLDISANKIYREGLISLLDALNNPQLKLHTLECRKNQIEGEGLTGHFNRLRRDMSLCVLNLQDNDLNDACAQELLGYAQENFMIEHLKISANPRVQFIHKDQIDDECRKNLLIREYVLPKLAHSNLEHNQEHREGVFNICYSGYDVKRFEATDEDFFTSDFIVKFARTNLFDLETLVLRRMTCSLLFRPLVDYLAETPNPRLVEIHLEKVNLDGVGKQHGHNLRDFLLNCKNLKSLRRLRLIEMGTVVQRELHTIRMSFHHSRLQELDLSRNKLTACDEVAVLIHESESLQHVNLCGSELSELEVDKLWLALHHNITLLRLNFDRNTLVHLDLTLESIDCELELNKQINDEIMERLQRERENLPTSGNGQTHAFSYHRLDLSGSVCHSIEGLIKLARLKHTKHLDLSKTQLDPRQIGALVSLVLDSKLELEVINLSGNAKIDDQCAEIILSLLANPGSSRKELILADTSITLQGMTQIIQATSRNNTVRSLDFTRCPIEMKHPRCIEASDIEDALSHNCSLSTLKLDGCIIPPELLKSINECLQNNKLITDHIFPLLYEHMGKQRADQKRKAAHKETPKDQPPLAGPKEPKITKSNDYNSLQPVTGDLNQGPNNMKASATFRMKKPVRQMSLELERPSPLDIPPIGSKTLNTPTKKNSYQNLISQKNMVSTHTIMARKPDANKLGKTFALEFANSPAHKIPGSPATPLERKKKFGFDVGSAQRQKETSPTSMKRSSMLLPDTNLPIVPINSNKVATKRKTTFGVGTINPQMARQMAIQFQDVAQNQSQGESSETANSVVQLETDISHAHQVASSYRFRMRLMNKNFTSMSFLVKFLREFHNISDVDLGHNILDERNEMNDFVNQMKKHVEPTESRRKIKDLTLKTQKLMKSTLSTQKKISGLLNDAKNTRLSDTKIADSVNTLRMANLAEGGFLTLNLTEKDLLYTVDLSQNKLGNPGATQVGKFLNSHTQIRRLLLHNCHIGDQGCEELLNSLTTTKSKVEFLDLSNNPISDRCLKSVLALLYHNDSLMHVRYSLSVERNVRRYDDFQIDGAVLNFEELRSKFLVYHTPPTSLWQKIIFPIWMFQVAKAQRLEAIRLKYDTKALVKLEKDFMPILTWIIYLNAILYYIVVIAMPLALVQNQECASEFNVLIHYIFAAYCALNFFGEFAVVQIMNCRIGNRDILQLNSWHFFELLFGLVARLNTYIGVCIASVLLQCEVWQYFVPAAIFIVLQLVYPTMGLFQVFCRRSQDSHRLKVSLPNIQRNSQLCYMRENLALAIVLDSFCIRNYIYANDRQFGIGRISFTQTILLQDLPQLFIHFLILMFIQEGDYNVPDTDFIIILSLGVTILSALLTIVNFCTINPISFDPVQLELELKQRQELCQKVKERKLKEKRKKRVLNMKTELISDDKPKFKKVGFGKGNLNAKEDGEKVTSKLGHHNSVNELTRGLRIDVIPEDFSSSSDADQAPKAANQSHEVKKIPEEIQNSKDFNSTLFQKRNSKLQQMQAKHLTQQSDIALDVDSIDLEDQDSKPIPN